MIVLFEHSEKRLGDILKFEAQIHGAKIEEKPFPISEAAPKAPETSKDGFMFGDPDAYKEISQEERERLTQQMMGRHKRWVQGSKPLGGKKMR